MGGWVRVRVLVSADHLIHAVHTEEGVVAIVHEPPCVCVCVCVCVCARVLCVCW